MIQRCLRLTETIIRFQFIILFFTLVIIVNCLALFSRRKHHSQVLAPRLQNKHGGKDQHTQRHGNQDDAKDDDGPLPIVQSLVLPNDIARLAPIHRFQRLTKEFQKLLLLVCELVVRFPLLARKILPEAGFFLQISQTLLGSIGTFLPLEGNEGASWPQMMDDEMLHVLLFVLLDVLVEVFDLLLSFSGAQQRSSLREKLDQILILELKRAHLNLEVIVLDPPRISHEISLDLVQFYTENHVQLGKEQFLELFCETGLVATLIVPLLVKLIDLLLGDINRYCVLSCSGNAPLETSFLNV